MTIQQLREVLNGLDPSAVVFLREDEVDAFGPYLVLDQLLSGGRVDSALLVTDPEDADDSFER